jgi:hypothetical protein
MQEVHNDPEVQAVLERSMADTVREDIEEEERKLQGE